MKKTLLFFVACMMFVFYAGVSFGQCTPDPLVTDPEGNGEMIPDTIEVGENSAFNLTLTIIAPDTASVGTAGHINLHHITVKSLNNKPSWLTYACNPSNCEFIGTASRCVLVSGTAPLGSAGYIAIDVIVDVYASILGAPVLVQSDYNSGMPLVILVHPEGWGVTEQAYKGFGIMQATPNPFTNTVKLGCFTENPQNVSLKVVNMVGQEVYSEVLSTHSGDNFFQFNGNDLTNGVYFYSVIDAQNRVITKKLIKSN
jgi:hypothetical protein